METYKIILEYDGTRYGGYRNGKKGSAVSIQDKIEAVLTRMEDGQSFHIAAAVNTEAGVHSMGQTISYATNQQFNVKEVKEYMNQYLPMDIVVREVIKVRNGFHAELAKKGLLYQYRLQTGSYRNVMEQAYMEYEPMGLDLVVMREGIKLLHGEVDLMALNSNPRLKKSTLRRIEKLKLLVDREEIKIECQIDQVWPGLIPAIFGVILQLGRHEIELCDLQLKLEEMQLGSLYYPVSTKGIILQKVLYEIEQ